MVEIMIIKQKATGTSPLKLLISKVLDSKGGKHKSSLLEFLNMAPFSKWPRLL